MRITPSTLAALLLVLAFPQATAGGEGPPVTAPADPAAADPAAAAAELPATRPEEFERLLRELSAVEDHLGAVGVATPVAAPTPPAPPWTVPGGEVGESAEARAFEQLEDTGVAPVLAVPAARLVPFGHEVPTLTCVPTRACSLELEPGEVVDGYVLGDPTRWQTTELAAGADPLIPVFVVKPSEFDLHTNLILVTSRRVYHAELVSPREDAAAGAPYDYQVKFWYPEAWAVRKREVAEARARAVAERATATPLVEGLDPASLNWDYQVVRPGRRHRLPWVPSSAFDDGRRTFLRIPPGVEELPAVFGLLNDGELYPLNARLQGEWLVVPAIFSRAELVVGTGKDRRSTRIVNRRLAARP